MLDLLGMVEYMCHETSHHHRRMKCHQGDSSPQNISVVDKKKHEAYHTLFQSMTAEKMCDELNANWIDIRFKFICVKK